MPKISSVPKMRRSSSKSVSKSPAVPTPPSGPMLIPETAASEAFPSAENFKKHSAVEKELTPAPGLSSVEILEWLEKKRDVGLYVFCDDCDKIRYLANVNDPLELPDKWYCYMNEDCTRNSCCKPEEKIPEPIKADLISNAYNAGSIVCAKVVGFPWWPAMVSDDPDLYRYYQMDGKSDVPTHYHVTFFDQDFKKASRAWVAESKIVPFNKITKKHKLSKAQEKKYGRRLRAAYKEVEYAKTLKLSRRLHEYNFLKLYCNGPNNKYPI